MANRAIDVDLVGNRAKKAGKRFLDQLLRGKCLAEKQFSSKHQQMAKIFSAAAAVGDRCHGAVKWNFKIVRI